MLALRYLTALVMTLGLAGVAAADQPPGTVPGVTRERITVSISPGGAGPFALDAMVTRPSKPGRYPLMIWSHGTPRAAADRAKTSASGSAEAMIALALRGWTVVRLIRRGYGGSEGPYAEGGYGCANINYPAIGKTSAVDILEALKVLSRRDDVDASQLILAGVSAGGLASLYAAAEHPPGLVAVLNFAGGRGSTAPDSVCQEDRLVEAFGLLGGKIKVPTFWAYAANDHYFRPELAQRFHAAFTKSGGKATFASLPAFGEDGHSLTTAEGIQLWRDPLDRFLRIAKLPTWPAPMKTPTAFLPPPPGASPKLLADLDRYLATMAFEKAFAIGDRGAFAWRTGRATADEAATDALSACAASGAKCSLYAINNALVR